MSLSSSPRANRHRHGRRLLALALVLLPIPAAAQESRQDAVPTSTLDAVPPKSAEAPSTKVDPNSAPKGLEPSALRAEVAAGVRFDTDAQPTASIGALYGKSVGRGALFLEASPERHMAALLGAGLGWRRFQGAVDGLLYVGVATKRASIGGPSDPMTSTTLPVLGFRLGGQMLGAPAGVGVWADVRYEPAREVMLADPSSLSAPTSRKKFDAQMVATMLVRVPFDL